jgi:hypothetical protein
VSVLFFSRVSGEYICTDQSFDVDARGGGVAPTVAGRGESSDGVRNAELGAILEATDKPIFHPEEPLLERFVLRVLPEEVVRLRLPGDESDVAIFKVPPFVEVKASHGLSEKFRILLLVVEICSGEHRFHRAIVVESGITVARVQVAKRFRRLPLVLGECEEMAFVVGEISRRAFDSLSRFPLWSSVAGALPRTSSS